MGKYKNKAYPLRINEELMEKVKQIALAEERTANKEIEYILKKYVTEYTALNARLEQRGKLSESKIG